MPGSPRVVILGAGVTGLTTAWHLRRSGVGVTVLESTAQVGGVMQTTRRDGYLVEHGPNSCTLTSELATLVEQLGLTPQLRVAAPDAQRRYIVRDGVPVEVPTTPGAMLRSSLFTLRGKLRVLQEPWVAARSADDRTTDESVAAFIRRRLGNEPLDYAVEPFVSGVYAGDPSALSVRHAFPRLATMEREHGSLLRAMMAAGRKARVARTGGDPTAGRHTMVSFIDGLHTLPAALAAQLGPDVIRCHAHVLAIASRANGAEVTYEQHGVRQTIAADVVISTLPLHALARIGLPPDADAAVEQLQTVPYPPVASLALGYRRSDVAHALDGFGCLIPSRENRRTLGVLFSSTLFDGRAPDGYVLLTCFLGGTRYPAMGTATTDMLLDVVEPDLTQLLGVSGVPKFIEHTTWPRAIPQYNVGYDATLRAADALEAIVPGLLVDGQFRRGVSVGDCVASGAAIAARALPLAVAGAAVRPTTISAEHEAIGAA